MKSFTWILKRVLFILIIQSITLNFYINFIGINIYTKKVTFEKEGRKVILLGMSHVADKSYYLNIENKFDKMKGNILVLKEGINFDDELDQEIEINHSYFSKIFGLENQKSNFLSGHNTINSDIHVSELSEETSNMIEASFNFWKNVAMFEYKKAVNSINSGVKINIFHLYKEVILKRNELVKVNIHRHGSRSDILVPWGAIHNNDLENFLLKEGYVKKNTDYIKVTNIFKLVISGMNHFIRGLI